jgi:hypothetical protein
MRNGRQHKAVRCTTGVVVRRVAVRVIDLSATGCLLESSVRLSEGAVGTLHLTVEGRCYQETLRVSRLGATVGRSRAHRAGAQFLTLGSSRRGLRHLASSAQPDAMQSTARPMKKSASRGTRAVLVLDSKLSTRT